MKTLRAAVIGAGMMGRHHVRILNAMPHVELAFVVDTDVEKAAVLATGTNARVVSNIADLNSDVDIAVVAVPTEFHLPLGLDLIRAGISLMIEKPLALNVEEAQQLCGAASAAGVTLAVGHVERFNPVVRFLSAMQLQPSFLQFERMSPFTPRIASHVVSDLMVHDLDLACALVGEEPVKVVAVARPVFSGTADIAAALLEFPSGAIASLSASRATQDKVRTISITERERYIVADCLRQDLSIKKETTVEYPSDEPGLYRQANVVEIPYLDRSGEPLARELEDFIRAARDGSTPTVDGAAGLRAVSLVAQVERAAGIV